MKQDRSVPTDEDHKARLMRFVCVPESGEGCWSWTGSKNEAGYGRIRVNNVEYKANRLSYAVHFNRDPGNFHVLHKCDNPECTNPDHLFLGTHADNMRDASIKGRWAEKGRGISRNAGAKNSQSKITPEIVAEIRSLSGVITQREIAARYGLRQSTVSPIINGHRWRDAAAALETGKIRRV